MLPQVPDLSGVDKKTRGINTMAAKSYHQYREAACRCRRQELPISVHHTVIPKLAKLSSGALEHTHISHLLPSCWIKFFGCFLFDFVFDLLLCLVLGCRHSAIDLSLHFVLGCHHRVTNLSLHLVLGSHHCTVQFGFDAIHRGPHSLLLLHSFGYHQVWLGLYLGQCHRGWRDSANTRVEVLPKSGKGTSSLQECSRKA